MAAVRGAINESYSEDWYKFHNPDIAQIRFQYDGKGAIFNLFKLHVCVDRSFFSTYHKQIEAILKEALKDKVINSFKIFDVVGVLGSLKSNPKMVLDATTKRQMAAPFVIYLHNDFDEQNAQAVVALCQKIEDILRNVPFTELNKTIAAADIRLGDLHFIFRQTALDGRIEYLEPNGKFAPLLHAHGLKSKQCNALMIGLGLKAKPPVTKMFSSAATAPLLSAKEKEPEDQPQKKSWLSCCLCG